jgi:peptidylprolyl isomerase
MSQAKARIRIAILARLMGVGSVVAAATIGGSGVDVSAQTAPPTQPPAIKKPKAPAIRTPAIHRSAEANRSSAQKAGPVGGNETVARVGGTEIKEDDLRVFIAALGEREQAALSRDPALLSQVVRQLLSNHLVLKEALAKQWDERPEVAEQLKRAREIAIVESYLRSVSQPPADFPGESTVQSVYDANRSAFLVPRQFLIGQIFVAQSNDADKTTAAKSAKKIADIQLKLKTPNADFAAVARADSDAKETGDRGGEVGWLSEAQLRPEIRAVVAGLAKNAVSDPLKLDDGWHFVKLIDTKASYTRPIEEVRDQLVEKMRSEQSAAIRRAYVADLLKQTPPAINELALSRMFSEK